MTTVPSRTVLREIEDAGQEQLGVVRAGSGFLSTEAPRLHLPPSHRAWDEAAAQLPLLWRDMAARPVLRDLPLLSAEPEELPDADLWRASVILASLAYSYVRCDLDHLHAHAPVDVPESIAAPWRRVSERMGRPAPHVAYDDLITHNYRLIDPQAEDPVRLENLHLLVPLLGNDTERAFLGVNIEIQAKLAPVVEAAVRAQEAVVARDPDALVDHLMTILDSVRGATDVAFPKIDPNPHAGIYADPAIWAKLTAPTGIPIVDGVPGVSGAGSTGFQLVDTFLGRTRFESPLGGEARKARAWFAPNCRRFLDAIEETSVRRFVDESGDHELAGLFQSVLEAYAGDRGYLGVHRRKVYGFIEVAFKVGRPSTASGITGTFVDRTWHETDSHLGEARAERYLEFFSHAQVARLAGRTPAAGERIQTIDLDVTGTGVVFRPGDRCAILPEQTDELVQSTLDSLRATADREVPLTNRWRAALHRRFGSETPSTLPLGDFLRYAQLRPLGRYVAKHVQRLSGSTGLADMLEARAEDQFEFRDAVELAAASGYDVTRLWRAELWQDEAVARFVPPAAARMYSVSTPPDREPFATALRLTVGNLEFASPDPHGRVQARHGAGSTFLVRSAPPGAPVTIQVVRPLRFSLPEDPAQPIVMFAGGTGIAPFWGFVKARAVDPRSGPTWLFCAARTRAELPYYQELKAFEAEGAIELRTAFSREEVDGTPPRRIDDTVREPEIAAALRDLLSTDGGSPGALFYVCGQAAFAATILDSLREVAAEDPDAGRVAVRRLVGDGRLMTDLFTTFTPRSAPGVAGSGVYEASDLVLHNDAQHGWWMAINGAIYDMTEFRQLHPGGFRIIDDNAGLDATKEYEAVLHHEDPEIEATLAMYKAGSLRRLDFQRAWGIALVAGKIRYVPLVDAYKAWIRHLYLVVEQQNGVRNDVDVLRFALTSEETAEELTPLKLMLATDLQSRMLSRYLPGLVGVGLHELWALACGLFDPAADASELRRTLTALAEGELGTRAEVATQRLCDAVRARTIDPAAAGTLVEELRAANEALHTGVKLLLRDGLMVFEKHESQTIPFGAGPVLGCLRAVPAVVADFYQQVADAIDGYLPPPDREGQEHGRDTAAVR